MKMLIDRGTDRVRLQCGNCGAHALMGDGDYAELVDHSDGAMRCEVCGFWTEFMPTEPPIRERRALASR